mgnify:CR=1 FL=1
MAFTNSEIQEILNAIKAQSTDLGSMPVAAGLDGVKSLPGVRNGSLALVPLALLQEPAVTAAREARTAAGNANEAAVKANETIQELAGRLDIGHFVCFSLVVVGDVTPEMASYAGNDYSVVFLADKNVFAAQVRDSSGGLSGSERIVAGGMRYYMNWPTADMYMDASRTAPLADRLFMYGGVLYYWSGTALEPVRNQTAETSSKIVVLTQTEYDSLESKEEGTIYFITSAS